jgi:hypothetical protein
MNANELANLLEVDSWYKLVTREQIATMLRQQQAEYYSLLVNHDLLYAKVVEQQAEIESLKISVDELAGYKASYENCHRSCNGYGMN